MPPFLRTAILALSLAASTAQAQPVLKLDRVVMVMRHGIRAPLDGEVPQDTKTAAPWPRWPVGPGELTPHGAAAIARVAAADRRWLAALGLPRCPAAGEMTIRANTEQRTIATGQAYARGFAPGCTGQVAHLPIGQTDPMFVALGQGATAFYVRRAVAAIDAYTGGMARLVAKHRAGIALLDGVLACTDRPCSPAVTPTLTPSADGRGIDLGGPIRATSGIAQVLLLEHVEGMPARDVGWGRADAATITRLGALHAALFDVFTRSPYMAAHQAAVLGHHILDTLTAPEAPRFELLVGHDTNVTALAAALRVNLDAPGFARNDVAPGGTIVVERLHDTNTGRRFVRVFYRAQPLAALRAGSAAIVTTPLAVPGCGTVCPLDRFAAILRARIAPLR